MTWIVTYTGRRVDLFDPKPDQIDLLDIAHALSQIARFGGHAAEFYSVAQHSVHVWECCMTLGALLHDAAEAYIGDIVRPFKCRLAIEPGEDGRFGNKYLDDLAFDIYRSAPFAELEKVFQDVIAARFGIDGDDLRNDSIKSADLKMLVTEKRDVLSPAAAAVEWPGEWPTPLSKRICPIESTAAEHRYLARFPKHFITSAS